LQSTASLIRPAYKGKKGASKALQKNDPVHGSSFCANKIKSLVSRSSTEEFSARHAIRGRDSQPKHHRFFLRRLVIGRTADVFQGNSILSVFGPGKASSKYIETICFLERTEFQPLSYGIEFGLKAMLGMACIHSL